MDVLYRYSNKENVDPRTGIEYEPFVVKREKKRTRRTPLRDISNSAIPFSANNNMFAEDRTLLNLHLL